MGKGSGKTKQSQADYDYKVGEIINLDPQVWEYIKTRVGSAPHMNVRDLQRKRLFRETTNGLDLSRTSRTQECEFIRFETHGQLYHLRQLLGETIIASQRKRTKNSPLEVCDAVSHVQGTQEPERPFCSKPEGRHGFDFKYDTELAELKVTTRFGKYMCRLDQAGHPKDCTDPMLCNLITRANPYRMVLVNGSMEMEEQDDDEPLGIEVGDELEVNGISHVAARVEGGAVHTTNGDEFQNVGQVRNLIEQQLQG